MWRRPSSDVVKVNVDAAFQSETLSGATGALPVMAGESSSLQQHGSSLMLAVLIQRRRRQYEMACI